MHQNRYQQPTKREVRDWLWDLVASHRPPPDPVAIREKLWPEERDRRQVLQ